ncbi:hypothetical protein SO694_00017458 [Aureococcus anophagefferens]|uniref:Protein kinase domain-containing protein n=1 Tax=Aureococcus anophagefferens TaxID=44056 RepID=A0ABR1G201_AURAN
MVATRALAWCALCTATQAFVIPAKRSTAPARRASLRPQTIPPLRTTFLPAAPLDTSDEPTDDGFWRDSGTWVIVVCYFLQGALGLSRLALNFYLKDELHLSPGDLAGADGSRDGASYVALSGLVGAASFAAMAAVAKLDRRRSSPERVASGAVALSDVVVDSLVVEKARDEAEAASLQSVAWSSRPAVGSVAGLAGVGLYNACYKEAALSTVILWTTLVSSLLGLAPLALISHANRGWGLDDRVFAGDGVVQSVLGEVGFLPLLVLAAKICPPGIEGALFAALMSIFNAGGLGRRKSARSSRDKMGVTEGDFSNLAPLVVTCALSPAPSIGDVGESRARNCSAVASTFALGLLWPPARRHLSLSTWIMLRPTGPRARFPEPVALFYAAGMLEALDQLHGADFLHADVKPDNDACLRFGSPDDCQFSGKKPKACAALAAAGYGVTLIDYSLAVDLQAFNENQRFESASGSPAQVEQYCWPPRARAPPGAGRSTTTPSAPSSTSSRRRARALRAARGRSTARPSRRGRPAAGARELWADAIAALIDGDGAVDLGALAKRCRAAVDADLASNREAPHAARAAEALPAPARHAAAAGPRRRRRRSSRPACRRRRRPPRRRRWSSAVRAPPSFKREPPKKRKAPSPEPVVRERQNTDRPQRGRKLVSYKEPSSSKKLRNHGPSLKEM